ncbi:MAG: pyridoxal phosphate-dependent aminotransferase [candidate division Zixibacteria bacterium]|nr:pyridoxal phosphate-dependent aminotransferase [candidate division Zixibacteria bacterium]
MLVAEKTASVPFAARMADLGTETAFEVLARARELEATGRQIVHLEIGEPDFPTPVHIVEAGIQALRDGYTHYGPSAGLPETRAAISRYVQQTRGIPVTPDWVVVTPGAKPIMFFAVLALVDSGDEVIYPDPGFPIYESVIRLAGGRPVPIRLREDNHFRMDADELANAVSRRTKMIIINSPHNPTGSILTRGDLEMLGRLAVDHGVYILADEIYSRILYDGKSESVLKVVPEAADHVILLDGLSKTYAMTGWRLGWGVMAPPIAAAVARLQTNSNSCTASFSQRVVETALFGSQDAVQNMRGEFRRRRDAIVDGLNAIKGVRCLVPDGAFYVFPNISDFGMPAREIARRLLEEAGVAVLAGTSFGPGGEGHLRFSYANSIDNIREGVARFADWVSRL